jgi:hypothetical protein
LSTPTRHSLNWRPFGLEAGLARCSSGRSRSDITVGLNDGPAAGQTVPHCHIHLIPRYRGDVADPRGGVRWIIAGKAKYWTDP